jgi:hypothetical protein
VHLSTNTDFAHRPSDKVSCFIGTDPSKHKRTHKMNNGRSPRTQLRIRLSNRSNAQSSFSSVGNSRPRVSAKHAVVSQENISNTRRNGDGCMRRLQTFEKADNRSEEVSDACMERMFDLMDENVLAEGVCMGQDDSVFLEVEGSETKVVSPRMTALSRNGCEEPPTCLICFEPFDEDNVAHSLNARDSCVFSSAMNKNKKSRMPCKCQEGKECPEYVHQHCLRTWQMKMAKTSCPLCRQALYDPRAMFREAFLLSNTDLLRSHFISKPVEQQWGVVQCVIRSVTAFGVTRCIMYSDVSPIPVLEARRVWNSTSFLSPEYGIFANDNKVATLTSNVWGTTWSLKSNENEDLLGVHYTMNRVRQKEPRKMRLLAPGITDEGEQVIHHHPQNPRETFANMLNSLDPSLPSNMKIPFGIELFRNRSPYWSQERGAYCLNFGGRVKLPSVKNFQITYGSEHPQHAELETLIQFGRVEEDVFHVDVQFPFSALQAFGACVTSFYSKLAVE